MLSVIMSCFLSFLTISAQPIQSFQSVSLFSSEPNITCGEYEVERLQNGLVGRHVMVSVDSYEDLGIMNIDTLTNYYDGSVFSDFTISETVSTIEESTLSTSLKLSSTITSSLSGKVGLGDIDINSGYEISQLLTIDSTTTYSYSKKKQTEISFKVKKEVVNDKVFALCSAAYTYKIKCQTWQWDDF